MSQYQFSVDVLFSRDVAVEWFEAVALVQSVCRQILANPPAATGFPSPSQILLKADGSVTIIGMEGSGEAVPGAARLLADLRSADAPVQLRLLLTQATAADGSYSSLADFSSALAYFERSSPQALLKQLFERAAVAATRKDTAVQRPVELAPVEEQQKRTSEQARKPKKPQPVVAAAVVVVLLGGAVWFFAFGPGRTRVAAAGVTLMQQLGLGTPAFSTDSTTASNEPLEKETSAGRTASTPETGRRSIDGGVLPKNTDRHLRAPVRASASTRPAMLPLPVRAAAQDLLPALFSQTVRYEIPASPASALENSMLLGEPRGPDPRVYSLTDAEVVPPRAIYPTFPEPPRDLPAERRTVVEVVIDNDGSVERVRLRSRPRNIHEFMLLSAAKAWRFEPATIDGRPVRFLHSLTLIMQ